MCEVQLLFLFTMKATIYIFGDFTSGYSQFPDDNYTRTLFSSISKSRKSATELVYHRNGELTYYIYTREIANSTNSFIGLCYVFNGILITDFSYLFKIFEHTITDIVVTGEILEFKDDGNISTKVSQLYTNRGELQRISDYLNSKLSSLGKYSEKLPPIDFSISNSEWKTFSFEQAKDIQTAIKSYSNIRVLKGKNYETGSLRGYASKLKKLSAERDSLSNEIIKLKEENANLKRQKKQIKWVLFLLLLILIGGIIFYFYAKYQTQIIDGNTMTISSQQNNISSLQNNIIFLQNDIQQKEQHIASLTNDSITLTEHFNDVKSRLSKVHNELQKNTATYLYFDSWTSTNDGQPNSSSQIIYSFYAHSGDELNIPYFVSSEPLADYLTIDLKRNGYASERLVRTSGVQSSTFRYTFSTNDSYQLIVSYHKDHSVNRNHDNGGVHRLSIYQPMVENLRKMSEYNE